MGFWAALLINIALTALFELLRPKPKFGAPQPASLSDFNLPTALQGRPIPYLFGTTLNKGPNCFWYGDLLIEPIVERVRTGLWSSTNVTLGYKYSLGMALGLGSGPIDEVVEIRFGDRVCPIDTLTDEGDFFRLEINQPNLFGGVPTAEGGGNQEGGIVGTIDVYKGNVPQAPSDYLEGVLETDLPGHPGLAYAVFRRVYLGTTPYLKPFSIVTRATPNPLLIPDGGHNIGGDCNFVTMIYEVLTRSPGRNGLGISSGIIDVDNWRDVAEVLADEELGGSAIVDTATTGRELVQEWLRYIDGVTYSDPSTGLLTLKLARPDYDPEEIPLLDDSILEDLDLSRPDPAELKNGVRVLYTSRAENFETRSVQWYESGAIQVRAGELDLEEIPFLAVSNAATAQALAARTGIGLVYPFAIARGKANRKAWNLRPGMVRRVTWPKYGIEDVVFRITSLRDEDLTDGSIELNMVEDVFGLDAGAFTTPPPSEWEDPADAPLGDVIDQAVVEPPYPAVQGMTPPPDMQHRALTMAARPTGLPLGYNAFVRRTDSTWPPAGIPIAVFTPLGYLTNDLVPNAGAANLDPGAQLELIQSAEEAEVGSGINLVWIEDEWIAFKDVVPLFGGGIQLTDMRRGCIDTCPKLHPAGSAVWFVSYGSGIVNTNTPVSPATSITNTLRLQPFSSRETADFDDLLDQSLATETPARADRPYPPGLVKFNDGGFPSPVAFPPDGIFSDEITIYWSHRNRLGLWSYSDAGATDEAEPGTTYTVQVWGEANTLIHTETGLTGTSWLYPAADEMADSGLLVLNSHLRFRIHSVRGGLESWQYFEWEFDRA